MRGDRKRRHRRRFYGRRRAAYLTAVVIVMLLGLASRTYGLELPGFLAVHTGDALWAAMLYLLFRLLLPDRSLFVCAIAALALSFTIEFSQLYRADWINEIRDSTLGALMLGQGFLTADLARYAAGIAGALAVDITVLSLLRRLNRQK
ncbi:ribosomal maturation YjgA family protein [Saccharibacillus kuerlensis]|uniref:Membrane protein YjgA n=1 Tax=Saccharibacillus kuerlensis TaxID=459527 RepID=A0ABQ2KRU2_9BACL|nr:DUF2809 domain-containing protein [Saccharibacillus kuerlensis]GGN91126.1 putative membrane protein YjgA [Saccharibacillus kuerlensis]